MTFTNYFNQIFDGDKFMHVRITSIDPKTGKKSCTEKKWTFETEKHLSEEVIQGRSPVNLEKKACRWIGLDIDDENIKDEDFLRSAYAIDPRLRPVQSTNKRWHLYRFFPDWIPVEEAYEIKEAYVKKFINLGLTVDEDKCLPNSWNFEKGRPGAVLFLPTFRGHKTFYSPKGTPLSKDQVELAIKYQDHPLLVAMIGLKSGQCKGGRAKALFIAMLYLKYAKIQNLNMYDINNRFFSTPEDEKEIDHIFNDTMEKDKYRNKEGLKHLIHNYSNYTEALTNVKLPLPKCLKELEDAEEILENFQDVEPEDEKIMFFRNVIYIKQNDRFFDLRTFKEYKENAINIDYQKLFKKNTPSHNFAKTPGRLVVETKVYRPDKFKKDKPPIFKGEDGQLHINSYRPGGVEPIDPHTDMQTKAMLDLFMELMEFLYPDENERNWVLDFYSTIFQYPGRKIRHSVLTYSKYQQVGKSSLFKTIQKGLGEDNCSIISPKQAIDKSKAFLIDKQLVLIDELRIQGTKNYKGLIMDILKPLMTEEQHDARPLFQDWRTIYSTTCFAIFTNHEDAILVDYETEARHTVLEHLEPRRENDFYKEYWDLLKTDRLANVVKHFLLHRKIKTYEDLKKEEIDEDTKSPLVPLFSAEGTCYKTEALQRMSEKGDELFEEVKALIKQKLEPFHQDIVGIHEAFNYLKKEGKEISRQNELAQILEKLNHRRIGECKHLLSDKSPVLYCVRNDSKYKGKYNSDIASDYWIPINWKDFDMEQKDVDTVKHKIKTLLDDPQWLKDKKAEWDLEAQKKEAKLEDEVPF